MNRSLTNVLFGGIGTPTQSQKKIEGEITKATVDETVDALSNAENVIIVSKIQKPSLDEFILTPCRLLDTVWL
jgi:hypothetical protein